MWQAQCTQHASLYEKRYFSNLLGIYIILYWKSYAIYISHFTFVCCNTKIILVVKGLTCCICKMEQSQVFVNNKICFSLI